MAEKYSIGEIDKFLRDRGMSLEGNESTRRSRAKSRRMRESPAYEKTQSKYRGSEKGKQTLESYIAGEHKEVQKRYHQKNKPAYAARSAAYRAAKLRSTSPFMSLVEKLAIDSMYKGASALSLPKRKINVDHFVPFDGKFSSKKGAPIKAIGLHNIHNLRWMYEGANKAKKDLIPKQSLLQTETPTRNIFESIGRTMKHLYPPPVGSRSGAGGGGRWQKNRKTGKYEFIIM